MNSPAATPRESNSIPAETEKLIVEALTISLPEDPASREEKVWQIDDFLNVECKNGYPEFKKHLFQKKGNQL